MGRYCAEHGVPDNSSPNELRCPECGSLLKERRDLSKIFGVHAPDIEDSLLPGDRILIEDAISD